MVAVRDIVPLLAFARTVYLYIGENAISLDVNDPLLNDVFGDYAVYAIQPDPETEKEYGLFIRSAPVKVNKSMEGYM